MNGDSFQYFKTSLLSVTGLYQYLHHRVQFGFLVLKMYIFYNFVKYLNLHVGTIQGINL